MLGISEFVGGIYLRKCIRCETEMKENCAIKVAVCSKCGEVSIYIDNIEKINKIK